MMKQIKQDTNTDLINLHSSYKIIYWLGGLVSMRWYNENCGQMKGKQVSSR